MFGAVMCGMPSLVRSIFARNGFALACAGTIATAHRPMTATAVATPLLIAQNPRQLPPGMRRVSTASRKLREGNGPTP